MIGFLYTLLSLVVGLLNGLAIHADGSTWSGAMAQGLFAAIAARFLIYLFLED